MTKRNHVDTIDVFLYTKLCISNSTKLPLAVPHPKHFDLAWDGDMTCSLVQPGTAAYSPMVHDYSQSDGEIGGHQ